MKIEKLYSDYQEEERLYSTGNDELDELLERAFCEGYEYAQREFGKVKAANKAARKALELKQVREGGHTGYWDSLYELRKNRAINKAEATGAGVVDVHGSVIKPATKNKTLNQRINTKASMSNYPEHWRQQNVKKIADGSLSTTIHMKN